MSQDIWSGLNEARHAKFTSVLSALQHQCVTDSSVWFPDAEHSLTHHTLGMAGEIGEFCEHVKKIDRGSYTLEQAMNPEFMAAKGKETLAAEAADIFIYLLNVAELAGFNLYEEYSKKRDINQERWGK